MKAIAEAIPETMPATILGTVLGTILLAVSVGTALADEPNGPIVVEARREPQVVRNFVDTLSIASRAAGVLGRWNQRICPGVVGAPQSDAQFIIDQIARRAHDAGLETGATGCSQNITIVVAPNSDRFAQQLYAQRREMLIGVNGVESTSLGSDALSDFVNTPRAIRWWHVSQTVMADGQVLVDTEARSLQGSGAASARANQAAASGAGMGGASAEGLSGVNATRAQGTRLRGATRQDFNRAVIIIDSTRTAGTPLPSIADYVAFVALAQINPNASAGDYPTILNLFASPPGRARPTGMTSWDVAYLDALYHMTRDARNLIQERSEMARRMSRP